MHLPSLSSFGPPPSIFDQQPVVAFLRCLQWCYFNGYIRSPAEDAIIDSALDKIAKYTFFSSVAGLSIGRFVSNCLPRRARVTRFFAYLVALHYTLRYSTRFVDYAAPCENAVNVLKEQRTPLGQATRSSSYKVPASGGDLATAVPSLRNLRAVAVADAHRASADLFDASSLKDTLSHIRYRYYAHPWHLYQDATPGRRDLAAQPMWTPPPVSAEGAVRAALPHRLAVTLLSPSDMALERASKWRAVVGDVAGTPKQMYNTYDAVQRNLLARVGGVEQYREFTRVLESRTMFREKETLARPRADVWRMWLDATTTAAQYPAFRWSTKGWATVEGMVSGVQDMEAVAA